MADEPDNETETPAEPAEVAEPAVPEDAAPGEAAPEETVPEDDAPQDDAPDAAADAPEQADTPAQAEDSSASAGAQPAVVLSPKERRRKARSTHTGEARSLRSPEERHSERLAERRAKAARRRARRQQERAKRVARRGDAVAQESLAPVHSQTEGVRKVRQGVVVSDKADKTITVRIDTARRHRRYEKIVRSSSTLHAHDENNDAHEGDTVRVIESRPLSRTKRWKLVDVLEQAR
jgi:small subunit ribosomal protein S17